MLRRKRWVLQMLNEFPGDDRIESSSQVHVFRVGACYRVALASIPVQFDPFLDCYLKVMKFVIYKDRQGLWRWYLAAANNKKIANSGEGYSDQQDCLTVIGLVVSTTGKTPIYQL
jgi:uncharacterized protein YegP (UPF0339 family)